MAAQLFERHHLRLSGILLEVVGAFRHSHSALVKGFKGLLVTFKAPLPTVFQDPGLSRLVPFSLVGEQVAGYCKRLFSKREDAEPGKNIVFGAEMLVVIDPGIGAKNPFMVGLE